MCTIFTQFIKDLPDEESLSDACPSSSSWQMEPLPACLGTSFKGTGSPDEFFLKTYQAKLVFSVHEQKRENSL
jgi:hypothetical protein